ncbi:hypothetical protein B0H14DRAFT_2565453 [Mycena olivaceomarginata]|nr:hypothetical protein B0H14DRAFT_2565453 [Mycena olivaceomarginata]
MNSSSFFRGSHVDSRDELGLCDSCLELHKPQSILPMVRNCTEDTSIFDTKHVAEFGQEYDTKFEQEHDTKVEADKSAQWKICRCTGAGAFTTTDTELVLPASHSNLQLFVPSQCVQCTSIALGTTASQKLNVASRYPKNSAIPVKQNRFVVQFAAA